MSREPAYGPGKLFLRVSARKPPMWVLDYIDAQGRRRRQPLSSDKSVAQRRQREIIRQRDLELAGLGTIEGQSMPLDKLIDVYLDDLATHTTERHMVNVRSSLRRTLEQLRCTRVRDVRPIAVLQYRATLVKSELAPRTCNLAVDRLHAALEWGVRTRLIAENPIKHIERLPDGEGHQVCNRRVLSDDEIDRFLAAADQDDREQAARLAAERTIASCTQGRPYAQIERSQRVPQAPMWRAFLETSARYGELIALTWSDLDLDAGTMRLRAKTTKARKERAVPVFDEFVGVLRGLRDVQTRVLGRAPSPLGRVFLTPEGRPWSKSSNNAMRVFDRLLEKAGIARVDGHGEKVDIHALRHTAASRMARHDVPLVVTQRVMGHSDPKLTAKIYTHLGVEDLRDAMRGVARRPGTVIAIADRLEESA